MANKTINIGRWYDEEVAPLYFPDLFNLVSQEADLKLRRKNKRIGNAVQDIQSKLEILGYHGQMIKNRIAHLDEKLPRLLGKLAEDRSKVPLDIRKRALIQDRRVEFYDYICVAHLESLLIQGKALLDSLAQLYSISFNRNVRQFSKSGQNLLKDLSCLSKNDDPYKSKLKAKIEEGKIEWIDDLILYRDKVVHYGQLRGFSCPRLKLTDRLNYKPIQVEPSKLPNGQCLEKFVQNITCQIHHFVSAVMKILFRKLKEGHSRN